MQVEHEFVSIPASLLHKPATLAVYAELYRRGAARDGHAWVRVTVAELVHVLGYTPQNINLAIASLVRGGYLLAVRSSTGWGVPMFHLSPVQPAASLEKDAAQ